MTLLPAPPWPLLPEQRINLALAVIANRAWHPDDAAHVNELERALRGSWLDGVFRAVES